MFYFDGITWINIIENKYDDKFIPSGFNNLEKHGHVNSFFQRHSQGTGNTSNGLFLSNVNPTFTSYYSSQEPLWSEDFTKFTEGNQVSLCYSYEIL
jgi:hypothetical protein